MILIKTWYKTYDQELQAIVNVFKTWHYYLESYKYEVFILTDYNNLCWFMNKKSLSSCQVRWAQNLLQYHFSINYQQRKANVVEDVLSHIPQRSQVEQKTLRDKNSPIFHQLQVSLIRANIAKLCLSGLVSTPELSPFYQVFVYRTYILSRLC